MRESPSIVEAIQMCGRIRVLWVPRNYFVGRSLNRERPPLRESKFIGGPLHCLVEGVRVAEVQALRHELGLLIQTRFQQIPDREQKETEWLHWATLILRFRSCGASLVSKEQCNHSASRGLIKANVTSNVCFQNAHHAMCPADTTDLFSPTCCATSRPIRCNSV